MRYSLDDQIPLESFEGSEVVEPCVNSPTEICSIPSVFHCNFSNGANPVPASEFKCGALKRNGTALKCLERCQELESGVSFACGYRALKTIWWYHQASSMISTSLAPRKGLSRFSVACLMPLDLKRGKAPPLFIPPIPMPFSIQPSLNLGSTPTSILPFYHTHTTENPSRYRPHSSHFLSSRRPQLHFALRWYHMNLICGAVGAPPPDRYGLGKRGGRFLMRL
jgi:hypothetical protein